MPGMASWRSITTGRRSTPSGVRTTAFGMTSCWSRILGLVLIGHAEAMRDRQTRQARRSSRAALRRVMEALDDRPEVREPFLALAASRSLDMRDGERQPV